MRFPYKACRNFTIMGWWVGHFLLLRAIKISSSFKLNMCPHYKKRLIFWYSVGILNLNWVRGRGEWSQWIVGVGCTPPYQGLGTTTLWTLIFFFFFFTYYCMSGFTLTNFHTLSILLNASKNKAFWLSQAFVKMLSISLSQLELAREQLIVRLESFRKEQIGGAKVSVFHPFQSDFFLFL